MLNSTEAQVKREEYTLNRNALFSSYATASGAGSGTGFTFCLLCWVALLRLFSHRLM